MEDNYYSFALVISTGQTPPDYRLYFLFSFTVLLKAFQHVLNVAYSFFPLKLTCILGGIEVRLLALLAHSPSVPGLILSLGCELCEVTHAQFFFAEVCSYTVPQCPNRILLRGAPMLI